MYEVNVDCGLELQSIMFSLKIIQKSTCLVSGSLFRLEGFCDQFETAKWLFWSSWQTKI